MRISRDNILMRGWREPNAKSSARSEDVSDHVAAFLASGREITQVASSVAPMSSHKAQARNVWGRIQAP